MDDDSWRNRKRQQSVLSDEDDEFDSQHRSIIDGETKKKRFIDDSKGKHLYNLIVACVVSGKLIKIEIL